MSLFGIQGYEPHCLIGRPAITAAHGRRLAGLAGRTLGHVWLVWDRDRDAWFNDAPVVLDFGEEQVEITHHNLDGLSVTWGTIDPARAIQNDSFDLFWRPEPLPQLAGLPRRTLDHVELLEWRGEDNDLANGMVAIGLDLAPDWLTVFNALDENGLAYELHPGWRRHPLSPES